MIKATIQSFKYALEGITSAFKSERNLKIHSVLASLAVIIAMLLKFSTIEYVMIALSIGLVLSLELINTAIEKTVDLACDKQKHDLAKLAKDISAGAVFFGALTSLIVGICLYIPKVIALFTK